MAKKSIAEKDLNEYLDTSMRALALMDTVQNALLRVMDELKPLEKFAKKYNVKVDLGDVKRNLGIVGLALDGVASDTRKVTMKGRFFYNVAMERGVDLNTVKAQINALKEANPGRMERVLKSANSIVDKIAENVADKVNRHLVRSKTESEATEMTKGYDLFAEESAPKTIRAYLDDDRMLNIEATAMQTSKVNKDVILALAERARIVDYGGTVIETIYEKEAK